MWGRPVFHKAKTGAHTESINLRALSGQTNAERPMATPAEVIEETTTQICLWQCCGQTYQHNFPISIISGDEARGEILRLLKASAILPSAPSYITCNLIFNNTCLKD